MTDTKFTPGPWKKPLHGGSGLIGKLPNGQEFQVASVGGSMFSGDDESNRLVWAADKANAHLIAAAPELYAALEEAQLQIEYLHEKFVETGSGNAVLWTIKTALAKARGEKQQ